MLYKRTADKTYWVIWGEGDYLILKQAGKDVRISVSRAEFKTDFEVVEPVLDITIPLEDDA